MKIENISHSVALFVLSLMLVSGCHPGEDASPHLRLVFFTDVHARVEWETPDAVLEAADEINAQKPDIVIGGGDLITDGLLVYREEIAPRWNVIRTMVRAMESPVYSAIGNHDLVGIRPADGSRPEDDPYDDFLTLFELESTYYSINTNGYHIIFLDSIDVTGDDLIYRGYISPEQRDWIEADLKNVDKQKPVILVTHIPLKTRFFDSYPDAYKLNQKKRVVNNSEDVLAMLEGYNLVLVLQGHLHISEVFSEDGVTFITGGAISGKWWRGAWYDTEEGFYLLDLLGTNITWEYVDYGWEAMRPVGQ